MSKNKEFFAGFVYSAWTGNKCSVPMSKDQKQKDLDDLELCAKGKGEFPQRVLEYHTMFKKYVKNVEKDAREYVFFKHTKALKERLQEATEIEKKLGKINCAVWVCEALDSERVAHPLGYEMEVKTDFCPFGKGDYVAVHWKYALEKVGKDFSERVNRSAKRVLGL